MFRSEISKSFSIISCLRVFLLFLSFTSPEKTNQTVLLCGGPGGGFGGPGGGFHGFLLSTLSCGFATTFTTTKF